MRAEKQRRPPTPSEKKKKIAAQQAAVPRRQAPVHFCRHVRRRFVACLFCTREAGTRGSRQPFFTLSGKRLYAFIIFFLRCPARHV